MTAPLPDAIQRLPAPWARFCLGIEQTLLAKCPRPVRHRHLLLACSAGSDSLALLLIMHCLAPRLDARISVAHLDHGLRPESGREGRELAELCAGLGRPMFLGRSKVRTYALARRQGLEEAGRILRYRFLHGLRRKIGAHLLLTAHHANDLAEDVVMRLTRGTGWPGLAGMAAWDRDRALVRPLLHTPKSMLRAFLSDLGLVWHEDTSNADPAFTRNRMRTAIIPALLQENPRFLEAVSRLHELGEDDAHYFEALLAPLRSRAISNNFCLDSSQLQGLHRALRLRLYKTVLDELGPGQALHGALRRLDRAWERGRIGAVIQFPGAKTGQVTQNGLAFCPKPVLTPNKENP
jgi:tRNA(Ile)-lysidine synthase